jgi:hypothetical protein
VNNKQDGMAAPTTLGFSYSTVAGYLKTDCINDNTTGLMWEGKKNAGNMPWEPIISSTGRESFNDIYWKGTYQHPEHGAIQTLTRITETVAKTMKLPM